MKHVIIGVGAAGISAAKTIREQKPQDEIVMISTDEYVHSRCMLHRYLSHERNEETISFVPKDFFETNNITWKKHTAVTHVDAQGKAVWLEDGTSIPFDTLLIATGADSFIPPVGQFREATNVFGLRNLIDAQRIDRLAANRNNVLIVGSGLVGMDAAYAMLELGKQVTVVEMADRILPIQLDETAGKPYQQLFESAGCRFLLGKKASETILNDTQEIEKVILDDGTEIPCDLVIVAAGVRPSLGCVRNSGIATDRFLTVNESMQTSVKDIYAAGDVAGLSGIWPNAMKQGQVAAYNMCGTPCQYVDTYAMKNTMNFYGLVTLSLGRGTAEEGDTVIVEETKTTYKKAIFRNHRLDSILLQGDIDYSGLYQYLIKHQIDLTPYEDRIFTLSFADFYHTQKDGQYTYE